MIGYVLTSGSVLAILILLMYDWQIPSEIVWYESFYLVFNLANGTTCFKWYNNNKEHLGKNKIISLALSIAIKISMLTLSPNIDNRVSHNIKFGY